MAEHQLSLVEPLHALTPLPVRNTFVQFDVSYWAPLTLTRSSTCPPAIGSDDFWKDNSTATGLSSRSTSVSSLHSGLVAGDRSPELVACYFDSWRCITQTRADRYADLSKAMSYVLRHAAKSLGVSIGADGFVLVDELVECIRLQPFSPEKDEIQRVVAWDRKQRFSLKQCGQQMWIRANQGHSMRCVQDDALLRQLTANDASLPDEVVHGTYLKHWPSIHRQGLKVGHRNHVHFARQLGTSGEVVSGARSDVEVAIYLDVRALVAAEIPFLESSNGVFLSPGVRGTISPEFFRRAVCLATGAQLWPDASREEQTGLPRSDVGQPKAMSNADDRECVVVARSRSDAAPWRPSPGAWRPSWMDGPSKASRNRPLASNAPVEVSCDGPWRPSPGAWWQSWMASGAAHADVGSTTATPDATSASKKKHKPGARQRARQANRNQSENVASWR